jgi:F420-0:gamma-glutamyl ligase
MANEKKNPEVVVVAEKLAPLTEAELRHARELLEREKVSKQKAKEYAEELKKDPRKVNLLSEKTKVSTMRTKLLIAKAVGAGLSVSDDEIRTYMRQNKIEFKELKF